jgi:hypothetical protein
MELDILVASMCVVTALHALKNRQFPLFVAGVLLGILIETVSLRFGGTHCHATGYLNFSECSSANSVFYYGPWVYSCITAARNLTDEKTWVFPIISGALFFGMCGVYEMQGPLNGLWLWPDQSGLVKAGWNLW